MPHSRTCTACCRPRPSTTPIPTCHPAVPRRPPTIVRSVPVAAEGPGFRPGATPLGRRIPVPRWSAEPFVRAPRDRRLRDPSARHARHPALSSAGQRQVHRRRELRAAPAHRPQPLVAPGSPRSSVAARRDVRVPLGRDRRQPRRRTSFPWPRRATSHRRRRSSRPTSTATSTASSNRRVAGAARSSLTEPTCSTEVST